VWQSLASSPPSRAVSQQTTANQNHVLIDALLNSAAQYSNLPQFSSMHLKSKKKKTTVTNIVQLAYTFAKLGDNLTNINGDILNDT